MSVFLAESTIQPVICSSLERAPCQWNVLRDVTVSSAYFWAWSFYDFCQLLSPCCLELVSLLYILVLKSFKTPWHGPAVYRSFVSGRPEPCSHVRDCGTWASPGGPSRAIPVPVQCVPCRPISSRDSSAVVPGHSDS